MTTTDPREMSGLELLRYATALPMDERAPIIGDLFKFSVDELEEGRVVFSLPSDPAFANPLGSLHGGACATLLDSVMGCAVHTTLEAGVGYGTLELKVNYIRTVPVDGQTLTGTGTTIHVGRQVATAEGQVVDASGRLVAHATTTCLIYR
ncbi:PaaI family thioesterase [Aeromicrobium piscarium]|uniref:PaaI family thioesterase n=1 Tax=Aeromicrobium piscarium TaxID=2590901 RepID=A0A554S8M9_9ACTN|nr:PaaI family thioesterase [Aeromicrobium piscarium]TSD62711.1 PaaI family thioesterase [Aeromicrobium piscarium]